MGDGDWGPDDGDEALPPSIEELTDSAPRTTDSANADAIVVEHGAGYRYVLEWSSWIAWSGQRWEMQGARGKVLRAAMLTARLEHFRTIGRITALEAELAEVDQENTPAIKAIQARIKGEYRLLKWHEQSQNNSRLEAAAKILETRLVISKADLDRDPWLFNATNGTIDLRTGDIRDHDRADFITQIDRKSVV